MSDSEDDLLNYDVRSTIRSSKEELDERKKKEEEAKRRREEARLAREAAAAAAEKETVAAAAAVQQGEKQADDDDDDDGNNNNKRSALHNLDSNSQEKQSTTSSSTDKKKRDCPSCTFKAKADVDTSAGGGAAPIVKTEVAATGLRRSSREVSRPIRFMSPQLSVEGDNAEEEGPVIPYTRPNRAAAAAVAAAASRKRRSREEDDEEYIDEGAKDDDEEERVPQAMEEDEEAEEKQVVRGRRASSTGGRRGRKPAAAGAAHDNADGGDDDEDDGDWMQAAPAAPRRDEEGPPPEGDVSEVFAHYKPHKLRIGRPHPGKVVETTVLARAVPPDIWYDLHPLLQPTIDSGNLSNLQLESIVYACQQHERTKVNEEINGNYEVGGFFLGDAAGVGKGRTISGLILENWHRGRRRHMWFSVSNDLYHDAQRDLNDVGAGIIPTMSLNDLQYNDKRLKDFEGILFVTYACCAREQSKGTISRVDQIVKWAGGEDFNGCLVFDEGHKAKKLLPEEEETGKNEHRKKFHMTVKSTKTALRVNELQTRLPKARVLYCSATGASALENLSYMRRLGLYGGLNGSMFNSAEDFFKCKGFRGSVGALELISMGLKTSGKYTARSLSFADTTFEIKQTPINDDYQKQYDASVDLWYEVLEVMENAKNDLMMGRARYAAIDQDVDPHMFVRQYWGSHQRFFRYLIIASKIPHVIRLAKKALHDGKCVVIGLLGTGEASTKRYFQAKARAAARGEVMGGGRGRKRAVRGRIKINYAEDRCDDDDDKKDDKKDIKPMVAGGGGQVKAEAGGAQKRRRRSKEDDDDEDEYLGEDDDDDEEEDEDVKVDVPRGGGGAGGGVDRERIGIKRDDDDEDDEEDRGGGDGIDDLGSDDDFMGIESTLIEIIKKYIPDFGQGGDKNGHPFGYAQKKKELIDKVKRQDLPQFPLDELIYALGGSEKVAEITGRKQRLEFDFEDGDHQLVNRARELGCTEKRVNLTETRNFMSGRKLVAIISDAGSTGISLHADRRARNQRRRVHITLELPFNSSQLVQQLGRSHRSNQVSGPEYLCVVSELPGEVRFASTASKRLMAMGAITQGDRMACMGSSELTEYDIDNKWGVQALDILLKFVIGQQEIEDRYLPSSIRENENSAQEKINFQMFLRQNLCLVDLAKPYAPAVDKNAAVGNLVALGQAANGDLVPPKSVGELKKRSGGLNIGKFLNRLLALSIEKQNQVFSFFETIHQQVIADAKAQGVHDAGVVDVYFEQLQEVVSTEKAKICGLPVTLHTIKWDRGIAWDKALAMKEEQIQKLRNHYGEDEREHDDEKSGTGFYRNKAHPDQIVLCLEKLQSSFRYQERKGCVRHRQSKSYTVITPNSGRRNYSDPNKEWSVSGYDMDKYWTKIKPTNVEGAEKLWTTFHEKTLRMCVHHARGEKQEYRYDAKGKRYEVVGNAQCGMNPNNEKGYNARNPFCPIGRRNGRSFILSGNITPLWPMLEDVVLSGKSKYIQIVRCPTQQERVVGMDIRWDVHELLEDCFQEMYELADGKREIGIRELKDIAGVFHLRKNNITLPGYDSDDDEDSDDDDNPFKLLGLNKKQNQHRDLDALIPKPKKKVSGEKKKKKKLSNQQQLARFRKWSKKKEEEDRRKAAMKAAGWDADAARAGGGGGGGAAAVGVGGGGAGGGGGGGGGGGSGGRRPGGSSGGGGGGGKLSDIFNGAVPRIQPVTHRPQSSIRIVPAANKERGAASGNVFGVLLQQSREERLEKERIERERRERMELLEDIAQHIREDEAAAAAARKKREEEAAAARKKREEEEEEEEEGARKRRRWAEAEVARLAEARMAARIKARAAYFPPPPAGADTNAARMVTPALASAAAANLFGGGGGASGGGAAVAPMPALKSMHDYDSSDDDGSVIDLT